MRRSASSYTVAMAAALVACASWAWSQSAPKRSDSRDPSGTQDAGARDGSLMTPGREAAALKFAQIHHPELEKLLVHLERSNPAEYRRAIRKLYQDSERLARTAERSPERHELELDAWKLDSRIRLLVARMSMSGRDDLDARLKSLLHERVQLRLRQLQAERERIQSRLANVEKSISDIESDPEAAALKDLQRVKRSLGIPVNRPAGPPARRNAGEGARPFVGSDRDAKPDRNSNNSSLKGETPQDNPAKRSPL